MKPTSKRPTELPPAYRALAKAGFFDYGNDAARRVAAGKVLWRGDVEWLTPNLVKLREAQAGKAQVRRDRRADARGARPLAPVEAVMILVSRRDETVRHRLFGVVVRACVQQLEPGKRCGCRCRDRRGRRRRKRSGVVQAAAGCDVSDDRGQLLGHRDAVYQRWKRVPITDRVRSRSRSHGQRHLHYVRRVQTEHARVRKRRDVLSNADDIERARVFAESVSSGRLYRGAVSQRLQRLRKYARSAAFSSSDRSVPNS
jgi:hypothetical protein